VLSGIGLTFNAGNHLTNNAIGRIHIANGFTGTGTLIKTGSGTLRLLGGTASVSPTVAVSVMDGLLELSKVAGQTAIPGALTIGDGGGADNSAMVRLLASDQIANASNVTIANDGQMDANGNSDAIGDLTLVGGQITTGAGLLTLGGDVTVNAGASSSAVNGHLSLGGATCTFNLAGANLSILADISGSGGLAKTGPFDLTLHASNSFTGGVTVDAGILYVDHGSGLGATSAGTVVQAGATLGLLSAAVGHEPLTLDSTNTSLGALLALSASNFWAGPVTLARDTTLRVDSTVTLHVSGAIGGPGSLNKINAGTLIFSGPNANTYAGTTSVKGGTLLLGKTVANAAIPNALIVGDGVGGADADVVRLQGISQLSDSAAVAISGSGLLDADGFTEVIGPVSGTGNLQLDASIFTVGFIGGEVAFNGVLSGSGTLIRNGTGTWILNGINSFSGGCTLNAPTIVNGSLPANLISLNSTLGGTGTVGRVTLGASSTISPGQSPGRLTTSNLSFIVTSKYQMELNGTTPGSGYDQLKVNGSVNNLASATLNATLGFNSASSNIFTIIDNDGTEAVTNTFLGLGEGTTFNISGTPFIITYKGGTGNDVVLTQLGAMPRPRLNITRSGATNVLLSWATNFPGYTLEANTDLNTNAWSEVAPAPGVSGTNNVVTNATSGAEKFYRLRSP
jgi:autotransporter-associated beta strand protein